MSPAAKILIVDDEQEQLMLRKMLLETAGHEVLTAHSGRQVLKSFNRKMWMP